MDLSMDRWLVIGGLFGLLGIALWAAYREWILVDVELPAWAWAWLVLGAGVTFLVGAGLMALIFYSSRKGYDEAPHQIVPRDDDQI